MNRASDNLTDSNYDNARDRRADSVRFGKLNTGAEGLAGNQANKGMLTEAVAAKIGGSRRQAARILDSVLDSITELLNDKGRVALKGFGTFERKIRKGRAYKHPVSGKSIEVADKNGEMHALTLGHRSHQERLPEPEGRREQEGSDTRRFQVLRVSGFARRNQVLQCSLPAQAALTLHADRQEGRAGQHQPERHRCFDSAPIHGQTASNLNPHCRFAMGHPTRQGVRESRHRLGLSGTSC